MTLIIKLGHNGHTRKLTQSEPPTWDFLAAKIAELYKIPLNEVAVSQPGIVVPMDYQLKRLSPGLLR